MTASTEPDAGSTTSSVWCPSAKTHSVWPCRTARSVVYGHTRRPGRVATDIHGLVRSNSVRLLKISGNC